jgi:dynein heavy chain
MKTQPELEAFEAELKKYMAIETEVSNISPVYNIGELTGLGKWGLLTCHL